MGIEDLPVLNVSEPIDLEGGSFEEEEQKQIPLKARLIDPSGRTMNASIERPSYDGRFLCYQYSPLQIS